MQHEHGGKKVNGEFEMIGSKKYKLGVFHPLSFDNKTYMFSELNKRVGDIDSIAFIRMGGDMLTTYCQSRGVPFLSCPIEGRKLFPSAKRILEYSDKIIIFDNGESNSIDKIIDLCIKYKKQPKVIFVENIFPRKHVLLLDKIKTMVSNGEEIKMELFDE